MSLLQNSVSFAEALQFFGLKPCKTAFFIGSSYKTEVLQEPRILQAPKVKIPRLPGDIDGVAGAQVVEPGPDSLF